MTNRLAEESSPYLRQHQNNPVDWHSWGPSALRQAEIENKPILLSIGYAACHWCHVMAHESFEDKTIAALMNQHFINIKVDREERPDLDAIYQSALSLMGVQGGWPLTMFLTPKAEPFAGGTYFPPTPRYGQPGFPHVLEKISQIWSETPDRVDQSKSQLMAHLVQTLSPSLPGALTPKDIHSAADALLGSVDWADGGIGAAPKFPNTPTLELLWQTYLDSGNETAGKAVVLTLEKMCQGGIYDHLGGGFARYSVDAQWVVPHFEKMLYDNAALVAVLTKVWTKTRQPLFAQRVEETIDWAKRDMQTDTGFAASLDADSDGEEGKFYVWTPAEIEAVLGADEASYFCAAYDVCDAGNFEGKSILNRLARPNLRDGAQEARLADARRLLLSNRQQSRIPPPRDDKVLTDWNALWICALTAAGSAFHRADWIDLAQDTFEKLFDRHRQQDGGQIALLHSSLGDADGPLGMAEDYANLIAAAHLLHEATSKPAYLVIARDLTKTLEDKFAAPGGGFYQSSKDAKDIIVRSRSIYDNAVPPANATMLANYARSFAKSGERTDRDKADTITTEFAGLAQKIPTGTTSFLNGFSLLVAPTTIAVCIPPAFDRATNIFQSDLIRAINQLALPNKVMVWPTSEKSLTPDHPAFGKHARDNKVTIYICEGQTCSAPITLVEELVRYQKSILPNEDGETNA